MWMLVMKAQTIPKKVYTLDEVKSGERSHQICIFLRDVPGALAKAAKVLADANVNIKTGSTFYLAEYPNVGIWSCFIDVSKATKDVKKIEGELRKTDVVLDVLFKEPKPTPFESFHFPTLHGTTRAMIMPIGMFWALWDGFERILQHSGLAAVLYSAGKNTGSYVAKRVKEIFSIEGKDLVKALAQFIQSTGWGIIEVNSVDLKHALAAISVKDCFEAAAWRRKPYNVCHWTRGYLAGYMSAVFKKSVEAVEAKCMAKGDERCEFHIRERI